jgi:hypothetical protein
MTKNVLTKNYTPRITFNSEYGIDNPINEPYVNSLAGWLMDRIKRAAKPYHQKHYGVSDNGNKGKIVTITMNQLKQKIKDTKGLSPDGVPIYFGPTTLMTNPNRAIELGLMTDDENQRKPSVDRIDSGLKVYSNENVQIGTKKYNLGKSDSKVNNTFNPSVQIKIGKVNITLDNCSPQYLAAYTQSLAV